jgi:hypothetical protein
MLDVVGHQRELMDQRTGCDEQVHCLNSNSLTSKIDSQPPEFLCRGEVEGQELHVLQQLADQLTSPHGIARAIGPGVKLGHN